MANPIRVINVRSYEAQPGEKYIYSARGSALGNPFSWLEGTKADFTCADREESLYLYKAWLDEQISLRVPAVVSELNRLYKLAQQQPLALGCYCFPKACHLDYVRQILNSKLNAAQP